MKKILILLAFLVGFSGCSVLGSFGILDSETGKLNKVVDKFIMRLCEEPLEVRLLIREEFAAKGIDTKMACERFKP